MLIILLGYMGCGKSSVGELLAEKLNYKFIDLDTEIERQTHQSIVELFQKQGEDYFRKVETEALSTLIQKKNTVLAAGGGTPCFNDNMELMNNHARTIYLKTPVGVLFSRLARQNKARPLIRDLTNIQLMDYVIDTVLTREKFYNKSEYIVETENLPVGKVVETVIKKLNL